MSSLPTDWMRWLGSVTSQSDTVSRQVVDSWTEWLNGMQNSEEDDNFSAWREAVPDSILALSTLITQLRGWMKTETSTGSGVDMESIKRRVDVLERELTRLQAKVRGDEDKASEDPGSTP